MTSVNSIIENGHVVGWACVHGHKHTNQGEALTCEPEKYAALMTERSAGEEARRKAAILDSPDYESCIGVLVKLFDLDENSAEENLLRVGIEPVLQVRQQIANLNIKKAPAKPPTKPGPPAPKA